jgi:hypothetical protein
MQSFDTFKSLLRRRHASILSMEDPVPLMKTDSSVIPPNTTSDSENSFIKDKDNYFGFEKNDVPFVLEKLDLLRFLVVLLAIEITVCVYSMCFESLVHLCIGHDGLMVFIVPILHYVQIASYYLCYFVHLWSLYEWYLRISSAITESKSKNEPWYMSVVKQFNSITNAVDFISLLLSIVTLWMIPIHNSVYHVYSSPVISQIALKLKSNTTATSAYNSSSFFYSMYSVAPYSNAMLSAGALNSTSRFIDPFAKGLIDVGIPFFSPLLVPVSLHLLVVAYRWLYYGHIYSRGLELVILLQAREARVLLSMSKSTIAELKKKLQSKNSVSSNDSTENRDYKLLEYQAEVETLREALMLAATEMAALREPKSGDSAMKQE